MNIILQEVLKIKNNCVFSSDAASYLQEYKEILKEMIKEMTKIQLSDSISFNFIVQMIPHHRAAIKMSENILKYTDNEQLKKIAEEIISEQTESIENMLQIKESCQNSTNSSRNINSYKCLNNKILQTMFCEMKCAYSNNCINCNFIREMIPHHEGAVRMSKNTLRFPICCELKPILEAIITSQEKGICQMKKISRCLSCAWL